MRILILCTGNSCRSQMAQGILGSLDPRLEVFSAGTRPEKQVNPLAVKVMKEIGIDISGKVPVNVGRFLDEPFDYVITVCDNARESCPFFTGKVTHRLHIGFEDPAAAKGTEDEVLPLYRNTRDLISREFRNLYEQRIRPGLT